MKVSAFLKSCLVIAGMTILVSGAYAQVPAGNDNSTAATGEHKGVKAAHPRRAQVNGRLNNQHKRIRQGVKNGTLTKEEAGKLRAEDKQIRTEEKTMASENGGHITKAEKTALNQQENAVSKEIHQEKHDAPAAN